MGRRRKSRLRRFVLWALLVLLIAGFISRRTLTPRVLDYIRYRPVPVASPDAPAEPPVPGLENHQGEQAESAPQNPSASPTAQNLSDARSSNARKPIPQAAHDNLSESDRRELDELLRRKAK